jgi:hypothetical protein
MTDYNEKPLLPIQTSAVFTQVAADKKRKRAKKNKKQQENRGVPPRPLPQALLSHLSTVAASSTDPPPHLEVEDIAGDGNPAKRARTTDRNTVLEFPVLQGLWSGGKNFRDTPFSLDHNSYEDRNFDMQSRPAQRAESKNQHYSEFHWLSVLTPREMASNVNNEKLINYIAKNISPPDINNFGNTYLKEKLLQLGSEAPQFDPDLPTSRGYADSGMLGVAIPQLESAETLTVQLSRQLIGTGPGGSSFGGSSQAVWVPPLEDNRPAAVLGNDPFLEMDNTFSDAASDLLFSDGMAQNPLTSRGFTNEQNKQWQNIRRENDLKQICRTESMGSEPNSTSRSIGSRGSDTKTPPWGMESVGTDCSLNGFRWSDTESILRGFTHDPALHMSGLAPRNFDRRSNVDHVSRFKELNWVRDPHSGILAELSAYQEYCADACKAVAWSTRTRGGQPIALLPPALCAPLGGSREFLRQFALSILRGKTDCLLKQFSFQIYEKQIDLSTTLEFAKSLTPGLRVHSVSIITKSEPGHGPDSHCLQWLSRALAFFSAAKRKNICKVPHIDNNSPCHCLGGTSPTSGLSGQLPLASGSATPRSYGSLPEVRKWSADDLTSNLSHTVASAASGGSRLSSSNSFSRVPEKMAVRGNSTPSDDSPKSIADDVCSALNLPIVEEDVLSNSSEEESVAEDPKPLLQPSGVIIKEDNADAKMMEADADAKIKEHITKFGTEVLATAIERRYGDLVINTSETEFTRQLNLAIANTPATATTVQPEIQQQQPAKQLNLAVAGAAGITSVAQPATQQQQHASLDSGLAIPAAGDLVNMSNQAVIDKSKEEVTSAPPVKTQVQKIESGAKKSIIAAPRSVRKSSKSSIAGKRSRASSSSSTASAASSYKAAVTSTSADNTTESTAASSSVPPSVTQNEALVTSTSAKQPGEPMPTVASVFSSDSFPALKGCVRYEPAAKSGVMNNLPTKGAARKSPAAKDGVDDNPAIKGVAKNDPALKGEAKNDPAGKGSMKNDPTAKGGLKDQPDAKGDVQNNPAKGNKGTANKSQSTKQGSAADRNIPVRAIVYPPVAFAQLDRSCHEEKVVGHGYSVQAIHATLGKKAKRISAQNCRYPTMGAFSLYYNEVDDGRPGKTVQAQTGDAALTCTVLPHSLKEVAIAAKVFVEASQQINCAVCNALVLRGAPSSQAFLCHKCSDPSRPTCCRSTSLFNNLGSLKKMIVTWGRSGDLGHVKQCLCCRLPTCWTDGTKPKHFKYSMCAECYGNDAYWA